MVSGSEQKFLLGLGVSRQLASRWLGVMAAPSVYRCRQLLVTLYVLILLASKRKSSWKPYFLSCPELTECESLLLLFLCVFVCFLLPNFAWLKGKLLLFLRCRGVRASGCPGQVSSVLPAIHFLSGRHPFSSSGPLGANAGREDGPVSCTSSLTRQLLCSPTLHPA